MKGKIIRTTQELVNFFNTRGISKYLKFFAGIIAPDGFVLQRLHVNFNGASYTNMKEIEIGVPEYLVGKTREQVLMDAKWRVCHEMGHILYTPDEAYHKAQEKFVKYFSKKYGFDQNLLKYAANAILNGMEDGREEARFLENHPQEQFVNYFRFGRSQWYLNQDFSKGKSASSLSPSDELFDGLFCLCTLATMGTLPLGWANKWNNNGDLYQLMLDARKYVNAFVAGQTFEDADEALWATIQHIEDWMVNLLKQIPVQQAQNVMQAVQQAQGQGNASQNNTGNSSQSCAANAGQSGAGSSGQSQNQSNGASGANGNSAMNNVPINTQDPNQQGNNGSDPQQSGQNPASQQNGGDPNQQGNQQAPTSPVHAAFQNATSDTQGSGGRISRMEDEYDGDYGTDMEKIVHDAMRAAETELAEGEENAIIQADWEDLQYKQQEEAKQGFDQKAADEVATYYKNINHNKRGGHDWSVPFSKRTYNLPKVDAPITVKNEAKKLNNQFSKILLSKKAINSRNRKTGLLNTHDLYKLSMNEQDIFMKKGNPRDSDFVFYVLMDGSGSMSGNKFNHALRACSLIEESLKGIAPVKIVVFDYSGASVRHHIVKEFKEQSHNASWAYANTRRAEGCNMDGFSLRVAANELMKRSEQHRVLITLSDGQPNGPHGYSGTRGENDVSDAVLSIRKKGIHVFNIFFGESKYERDTYLPSFMHMYRGKGVISCDPSAIGTELLRVVRRELC